MNLYGVYLVLLFYLLLERNHKGILLFSYFIWYGIGRFFIEGLRTDSLYLGPFRVSQIISIILILVGIIGNIFIFRRKKWKNTK